MTIAEGMNKLRLPNPVIIEDLETNWSTVIRYGEQILLAGYYWNGQGKPCYFGVCYETLDDDIDDPECMLGIREVSDIEFEDAGHALAWAMQQ